MICNEFQSTRPRGARPLNPFCQRIALCVSIHAPTWGATVKSRICRKCFRVSIHAPTWGATVNKACRAPCCRFQSTRPRGARPDPPARSSATRSFNPRAHVGRDLKDAQIVSGLVKVSIHAPTWGATGWTSSCGFSHRVSIHAPTWGATLLCTS